MYKLDGYNGFNTDSSVDMQLWMTEAGTAGDWVAVHWDDLTSPGAIQGNSFRIADSDEEVFDVVGVLVNTTAAAGFAAVRIKGIYPLANVADAVNAIGLKLSIGSTAGRAIAYTGTNPALRVIGVVQAAASSNLAPTILYPHPRFISI